MIGQMLFLTLTLLDPRKFVYQKKFPSDYRLLLKENANGTWIVVVLGI